MNKLRIAFVSFCVFLVLFSVSSYEPKSQQDVNPQQQIPFVPVLPEPPRKPKKISIRLLVLRHSPDGIAVMDAGLAKEAAEEAASQGLDIKYVGNDYIAGFSQDQIKKHVSEKMKSGATEGDTFIVHTIGHGFPNGGLQNIGQRQGIFTALAEAAGENNQKTLWWQLSCYATANLPKIDSLPSEQQKLFMVLASSRSTDPSSVRTQARLMKQIFLALAQKNKKLDGNGDNLITIEEMKQFLNTLDGYERGELLFANREDAFDGSGMLAKFLKAAANYRSFKKSGYSPVLDRCNLAAL